jgi:Zn-dependent protease with chaperone function
LTPTSRNFEGSLLHPDFGNDPVGGGISISATRMLFQWETGSVEIPMDSLDVEFEEQGPGIFFCDENNPDVKIYTLDQAILRHPAIKSHPHVAGVLGRREVNRAVRLIGYFLGACILITWLGSLAVSGMVTAIAMRVPLGWEQKLGNGEIEKLKKSGRILNDTNDVAQLAALAAPLIQVLPTERRDLKFYIIDETQPNAFALPGGHVVVTEGFLKLTDKPEEVLGVLAHELAHQTKRHAIRKLIAASGPLVIFGVFLHSSSGAGNILAMGSGVMVFEGFSQGYENEADATGWKYMVAANIDPRGMIHVLQKLDASEGKPGRHEVTPEAFQSHPATQKRIAILQKKWDELPRKTGFLELQPVTWNLPTTPSQ